MDRKKEIEDLKERIDALENESEEAAEIRRLRERVERLEQGCPPYRWYPYWQIAPPGEWEIPLRQHWTVTLSDSAECPTRPEA